MLVPVWFEKVPAELSTAPVYDEYSSIVRMIERHSILSDTNDVFLDTTGHPPLDSLLLPLNDFASLQRFTPSLQPDFHIGINISTLNDSIIITDFDRNSSAERAGVEVQDRIIRVNGRIVVRNSESEVNRMLFASSDSVVTLEIFRQGVGLRTYSIHKEWGEKEYVFGFYLDVLNAGYVRVKRFWDARDHIKRTVEGLLDRDIRYLIIDVRHNTGGDLEDVIESSKLFLIRNSTITWQRFNRYQFNKLIKTFEDGDLASRDLQIIILIDQWTSSGAELFAGILQENAGARLIGTPTAGNSSISRYFSLPDSQKLWLIIGYLYLPSGRPLESVGLHPDSNIFRYATDYRTTFPGNFLEFYQLIDSSDIFLSTVARTIKSEQAPR